MVSNSNLTLGNVKKKRVMLSSWYSLSLSSIIIFTNVQNKNIYTYIKVQ